MATQLQIVNDVLENLREVTVASVATQTYSKLIGMFVNQAKQDMENINHEWSVYETEISTSILSDGTTSYDLTGTNDRSWLLRRGDRSGDDRIPAAYDVTSNEVGQLYDCPLSAIRRERALSNTPSQTVVAPRVFAVKSDADGRGWTLELLWGADNARSWKTYWYVPQADLARDGTDDSTEILLPRNPIFTRALYYAQAERGEEMGEPNGVTWNRSVEAISAALETDMQVQKKSDQLDVTNCEYL
jgi:hypothetical protein